MGSVCLQLVTSDISNDYLLSWLINDEITYDYCLCVTAIGKRDLICEIINIYNCNVEIFIEFHICREWMELPARSSPQI